MHIKSTVIMDFSVLLYVTELILLNPLPDAWIPGIKIGLNIFRSLHGIGHDTNAPLYQSMLLDTVSSEE